VTRFGIDVAKHPTITVDLAERLRSNHGVTYVCRYLSHSTWKNLTADEARVWSRVGVDVVCVWETTATRAEDGYAAGQADARDALAEARSVGMPDAAPIYFAIDENTTVGPHITAYFNGVRSVLPAHRVGAYGGLRVVKGLFDAGLITYGWQTYAWSGGDRDPRAQLYQYSNGHTLEGMTCDYDTAEHSDFGQWRIGAPAPPKPTPHPPAPTPHPTPHPAPPRDVAGRWPYPRADYLATKRSDPHCHSGYYARDRDEVARWERQMQARGWAIHVDGLYGAEDEAIARKFQAEKHLTVDGKVGPQTWDHARHDPIT
jgi:hypothetical protein